MRNSESFHCGKIDTFGMKTRLPGQLNFQLVFFAVRDCKLGFTI